MAYLFHTAILPYAITSRRAKSTTMRGKKEAHLGFLADWRVGGNERKLKDFGLVSYVNNDKQLFDAN
jgi:hypothetical protein